MPSDPRPEMIETNLAWVFLTPGRAFKLLKPVAFPFLDQRDPEVRRRIVEREFELNQSFSPSIYLGVASLDDGSETPDAMLVMRRVRDEHRLDHTVVHTPECLRAVGRRIARLHADAPALSGTDAGPATPQSLRRNWQGNLDVLRDYADVVVPAADLDEVADLAAHYLDGRGELFTHRQLDGWVRAGHGDLRCEHVFVEPGEVSLIDCLAFRDDYRVADVLNDVAFLAMDLHRVAGPAAAQALMNAWLEFTNEHHPSSLAHFFVAYRAHVRAKVECLRHEAGAIGAAHAAREFHDLALHHLRIAQPRLILVGGGPGSGKSTLSQGLARRLGAVWIRSDEVRKDLAGLGHDDHAWAEPGEGIYSPDMTERVHEELRRQAGLLLGSGESVVVDATWSSAEQRMAMRAVAEQARAELDELRCVLPDAIARERIARRTASIHNPSDATPELVDHINAGFAPWPEARSISTDQAITQSLEAAVDAVTGRPSNTSHHEQRYFVDAPVTLRDGRLTMTHEGFAPVDRKGTFAPTGADREPAR